MGRRTKQPSSSSFWYSRSRSSSAPATPRPEPATAAAGEPPIGCMSMVHYLIFAPGAGCVGRPPTTSNAIVTPHDCISSKSGFEAPRNSLDLDADSPNDIQIGVQIEPVFDALASRTTSMRRSTKPTAPSSEAETPRTPSLVARLMGIDGLPDQHPSPAPAHHKKPGGSTTTTSTAGVGKENSNSGCCSPPASKAEKKKRVIPESMNRREPLRSLSCNVASELRSLPDTPRASTSARASWDGPRLSLQSLKENVLDRAAQYMSMPSSPTSWSSSGFGKKKRKDAACSRRSRRDEKAAAAKEHAREILHQAKETVASRKSGNKNSTSSSPAAEKRQGSFNNKENVIMTSSPAAPAPAMDDAKQLRVVVQVQQTAKPTTVSAEHHSPRVALAPRQQQQPSPPPPQRAKPSRPPPPPPPLDPPPPTRARKPDGCERFATRIKKPAACPASAPPTSSSSSSTTDCCSAAAAARAPVSSSPPLDEDPEYRYLRTVLERGGFMRSSPPPRRSGRGYYSVASPVDPIVFHLLELELPADDEARLGPLRHRWNRKLLFHLAQELLADLLLGLDASTSTSTATTGLPLLGKVWKRVRSFPAADCRVVGDIDALVAADLEERSMNVRRLARHPAVVEEAGDVAEEVADRVLDALLAECVAEESVSLSCAAHAQSQSSSSRAAAAR